MDRLMSWIESYLPGALPKWIFLGSWTLSIFLYKVYPDLPSTWTISEESIDYMLRLLPPGIVLLLGSMSLVGLLMYHNRKINNALIMSDHYSSELTNLIEQSFISHDVTLDTFQKTAAALQNQISTLQSSKPSPKKSKKK